MRCGPRVLVVAMEPKASSRSCWVIRVQPPSVAFVYAITSRPFSSPPKKKNKDETMVRELAHFVHASPRRLSNRRLRPFAVSRTASRMVLLVIRHYLDQSFAPSALPESWRANSASASERGDQFQTPRSNQLARHQNRMSSNRMSASIAERSSRRSSSTLFRQLRFRKNAIRPRRSTTSCSKSCSHSWTLRLRPFFVL